MAKRPLAQSLLSPEKEELEISVGKKYYSKILQRYLVSYLETSI